MIAVILTSSGDSQVRRWCSSRRMLTSWSPVPGRPSGRFRQGSRVGIREVPFRLMESPLAPDAGALHSTTATEPALAGLQPRDHVNDQLRYPTQVTRFVNHICDNEASTRQATLASDRFEGDQ